MPHLHLLYIDPGTGSMLFSVIMGLMAAGYFLLKSLWVKIRFFFSGKGGASVKTGSQHPFAIYSEGNQYWNVFLPVLQEVEARGIALNYLTSAKDDPALAMSWVNVSPRFIGTGNKAYAHLNLLEADICLMTTPGLDVYQLKRSRGVKHYAHVLHSVDDATSYRLFGLDYYDSVLLSGEYQAASIRALENKRHIPQKDLSVVGCPYLDMLSQKRDSLPDGTSHPFTVLVSPSWGPSGLLSRFGEKLLDALIQTGFHIIVRPHPQSSVSEAQLLERLKARYATADLEWDHSRDNIGTLSLSDVMISDFSGIIFDWAFLFNRPFFYTVTDYDDQIYDSSDLEETPWKFKVIPEMGIELTESMFADIGSHIQASVQNPVLADARVKIRDTAWQYRGDSGKRIVDYLIKKQGTL